MRYMRLGAATLTLCVCAAAFPAPAAAVADQASLQFTVPAPDPVQAGETISLQALAVNTGAAQWPGGSYYWMAEIYDVEYRFLTRTERIAPTENVGSGGVAAVSIPFSVATTATGRRFYRVYLYKDNQQLIESDYKAFQIIEKEIPPPPEVADYRVEGNVTVSLRDSSIGRWKRVNGSTSINMVGKVKDSSYLINANLLHEPGKAVDPYSILVSYYAPWGRIYAGDLSPTFSQLSVYGLGLRGGMLEQQKGRYDWAVLGGQSVTSQAGTATTNGRFARSIYAARWGVSLPGEVKIGLNAFQSADEVGSLSNDPRSANFRGPSLAAQKNTGMGINLIWQATRGISVLLDYQKNEFSSGTAPKASDTARRIEFRWEAKRFKFKTYMQTAGARFATFAAPAVIGDRNTFDVNLGLFPASWYTLNLSGNQYTDNLANDPKKLTTVQQVINVGNSLHLPTGTDVNLGGTMSSAKGKPSTALNNKTTTLNVGVTQAVKKHSVSLSAQNSQFRDVNKLAHDLDSQTVAVNTNLALARSSIASIGVTQSQAKDKIDGSKRANMSLSASYTRPLRPKWTGQFFSSLTTSKNTSPSFPSDSSTLSVNSEFTVALNKQSNLALGLGFNQTKDKIRTTNNANELVLSTRYSYSF
ncbi:MAG: hypothetical protein HYZ74_03955 [Elusimicrobia bacterium]|nr:hypothetical protein [Elusimicrobiota bacterium]